VARAGARKLLGAHQMLGHWSPPVGIAARDLCAAARNDRPSILHTERDDHAQREPRLAQRAAFAALFKGSLGWALGGTRTPSLQTLLCLSRAREWFHRSGELPVEFAGDVSLEAAADFAGGLPSAGRRAT